MSYLFGPYFLSVTLLFQLSFPDREKPLALYVFTASGSTFKKINQLTSAGGVTLNDVLMHCGGRLICDDKFPIFTLHLSSCPPLPSLQYHLYHLVVWETVEWVPTISNTPLRHLATTNQFLQSVLDWKA